MYAKNIWLEVLILN